VHTAITTPAAFLTYTTLYVPLIVSAIALIWDHPLTFGGALLAAPLMVLGAAVAGPIWPVVERPTRGRVLTFVTLAGICEPALTGVLDLALRSRAR